LVESGNIVAAREGETHKVALKVRGCSSCQRAKNVPRA